MADSRNRSLWNSKIGFLLAAVGSAIGLGNIWRFSYMAYEYGGGAFLIPYFVALLLAGIPLLIVEYVLGHKERASSPLAFARVSKRWEWVGWWMPTVAMFGIMMYYAVVIGWCINYIIFSFDVSWSGNAESFFFNDFLKVSESPFSLGGLRPPILGSTFLVWFLCWAICYREVNHGIEKACVIFMPLLFVLTLGLVAWTMQLDGAWEAIRGIYLTAEWSKIDIIHRFNDPEVWKVWVAAFGQIFFTLSLGFGIMITYSSYLPRKTDIVGNALWTAGINCVYSFIAGFAVFGVVGFMASTADAEFGEVIKGGPQLAFVVYPEAISQLPVGREIFGICFFLVLVVAGLSSGISIVEAFTCSIIDKFECGRKKVVTSLCLIGFAGSVIYTSRAGLLLLDIVDHFVTNYGLILGGLLECVLLGWILKASVARRHINSMDGVKLPAAWQIVVKFVTPICLAIVLLTALSGEFREAYGGYSRAHLLIPGIGIMILALIIAVGSAVSAWPPEKLKREHTPGEDHLLT